MGTLRRLPWALPWLSPAAAAALESGSSAVGDGPAELIAMQAAAGLAAVALLIVIIAIIKSRCTQASGQEPNEAVRPGSWSWAFVPGGLLLFILSIGGNTELMLHAVRAVAAERPIEVKITGHQGWWEYEYLGKGVRFESRPGASCRCDVDAPLVLPAGREVRLLGTSADIPLSFDLPSLGLHNDLIPGYMTDVGVTPAKEGTFRGGCGRRCGVSLRAPVVVQVVGAAEFDSWMARRSADAAKGGVEAIRSDTP